MNLPILNISRVRVNHKLREHLVEITGGTMCDGFVTIKIALLVITMLLAQCVPCEKDIGARNELMRLLVRLLVRFVR